MTTIKEILEKYDEFQIPRLDLEILLSKTLECCRTKLYSHPESKVFKKCVVELQKMAKQRAKGKPIAYLTNSKEFYGLNFYVDERVLIPRPETEMIIDEINYDPNQEITILDIGTGSGTIGLTLTHKYKKSRTILIDVCKEALEVTAKNAVKFDLTRRTTLMQSDLLANVEPKSEFNVITTNLPYIGEETYSYVSKETKEYEPQKALFSGKDGLDLYRKLFAQIKEKQIKFDIFIGEFGFGQKEIITQELAKYFENFEIKEDLAGIPRIFIVK
jgi:release factor glutamine methyltransferase